MGKNCSSAAKQAGNAHVIKVRTLKPTVIKLLFNLWTVAYNNNSLFYDLECTGYASMVEEYLCHQELCVTTSFLTGMWRTGSLLNNDCQLLDTSRASVLSHWTWWFLLTGVLNELASTCTCCISRATVNPTVNPICWFSMLCLSEWLTGTGTDSFRGGSAQFLLTSVKYSV